ncbi:CYP4V2 [Bugula neritina]|uniref:CYP4V2 n=1 Tax=Bugula neritina TaxID=10212 RepID=A0A7J7KF48_BUGNE|nr:CYP4V2 [Bugula neritina]
MKDACDTGQPYDILDDVTHNTLDIICDTAMGVEVNALHGENIEYVEALSIIKEGIDDRSRSPIGRFDFIYDRTAVGKKVNKAISLAQDFTIEVIKKRREMRDSGTDYEQKKHQPFLDLLLDCTDEDGLSLTDSDIREEVDTFMFESLDQLPSHLLRVMTPRHLEYSLRSIFLGRNLEEQKKCQQELDEAIGNPSKDITMDDLPKLKYLECCIKESMRLLPPVPLIGRQLEEDTTFGEYVVPKGTQVGMLIAALHQDPEQFPDPEKFNPNRFDQLNSELFQQSSVEENSNVRRDPFAYIPFSAGPRNCIGQKFALMELMIVVGTLLLNFNIESTQTREELGLRAALILQPLNGIHVKLTSRH